MITKTNFYETEQYNALIVEPYLFSSSNKKTIDISGHCV